MPEFETKVCMTCGQEKPLSEFAVIDKSCPDKRDIRCKSCYQARKEARLAEKKRKQDEEARRDQLIEERFRTLGWVGAFQETLRESLKSPSYRAFIGEKKASEFQERLDRFDRS